MELRILDEVMPLPGLGLMLMSMDEARAEGLVELVGQGALLEDARGNRHGIAGCQEQEGVYLLHLPDGDADYFERLFRNVLVDATLVRIIPKEEAGL